MSRSALSERPDPCRPTLCALGATPYAHCPCGLPMVVGTTLCDTCRSEGLQIDLSVTPASRTEWDGVSYPSIRLNRPADVPLDRYDALLHAIFVPVPVPQPATTGDAA